MAEYEEELEITIRKDGTSSIKVIKSKRPCADVSRPFEGDASILSKQAIPNPGQTEQQRIKGTS